MPGSRPSPLSKISSFQVTFTVAVADGVWSFPRSGVGRSTPHTRSISDTPASFAGGFGHPELAAPGRRCAVAAAYKFAELPRKFGGPATCSNCCVSLQSLKPGPRIYAFDNYTGLALMLINITGFKLYRLLSGWRGCPLFRFLPSSYFTPSRRSEMLSNCLKS